MRRLAIALALIVPSSTQALDIESDEALHAAAHIGASYAITHGTYAICKALTDAKTPCLVTGIAASTAAGIVKETLDAKQGLNKKNALRSMGENALGIGAATLMITVSW